METLLEIKNLSYSYRDGTNQRVILNNLNFQFQLGTFYVIKGESGSGKTTLLSLLGGLESLSQGEILFRDQSLQKIGLAKYRQYKRTMIFQNFNLINYLNAQENIINGMLISHVKGGHEKALMAMEKVGLDASLAKRPIKKLSGGEQQRLSIARSLASDVDLILADEPTGNLDKKNEVGIITQFINLAHQHQKCVIVVSHAQAVAKAADQVLKLEDGALTVV